MLRLPRELKSGTPQAQWLNQLLRAVRSLEAKQAPGVTVEVGPRGTEIRARKTVIPLASLEILRMRIIAAPSAVQAGDYLVCRAWDGTTESGEQIAVAKPWLLRRTTLHEQTRGGESYEYEADGQSRTVTHTTLTDHESDEVLYPSYRNGDEIIAFKPEGGTGVALAPLWQDMNVDARTFVHPYRFAQVCVNGENESIIVRRGTLIES